MFRVSTFEAHLTLLSRPPRSFIVSLTRNEPRLNNATLGIPLRPCDDSFCMSVFRRAFAPTRSVGAPAPGSSPPLVCSRPDPSPLVGFSPHVPLQTVVMDTTYNVSRCCSYTALAKRLCSITSCPQNTCSNRRLARQRFEPACLENPLPKRFAETTTSASGSTIEMAPFRRGRGFSIGPFILGLDD